MELLGPMVDRLAFGIDCRLVVRRTSLKTLARRSDFYLSLCFLEPPASIVISYWDPSETVPKGIWVALFLVALGIINFFGVKGYGEVEVVTSMIKIIAVIGFIITAIVIDVGGAPSGEYIGAAPWHNPGAFANGFKGFCSIFVTAAFAFAGTELVGLAAAETGNPRKEVPKASKQIFWRIIIFYVLSLFMVTLIVPYDREDL